MENLKVSATTIAILIFIANIVLNFIALNIPAGLGWLMALIYYILYLTKEDN